VVVVGAGIGGGGRSWQWRWWSELVMVLWWLPELVVGYTYIFIKLLSPQLIKMTLLTKILTVLVLTNDGSDRTSVM